MTREGYWKVFLKTSSRHKWTLFGNKNDVVDSDISGRLIVKHFQDFEYEKPYSKYKKAHDISDDALSGNKVIDLYNQTESVFFFVEVDSSMQFNFKPKQLRFSSWFTGDARKVSFKYYIVNKSDTLAEKKIIYSDPVSGTTSGKWYRKHTDISLPDTLNYQSRIIIEFDQKADQKLFMDDTMISIFNSQ